MDRRHVLATGGAAIAGLAGCLGRTGEGARPGTPDRTPPSGTAGTPRPDGLALSVALDRLQPGIVTMTTPDSIGVRDAEGQQYLFLDLDASAGTPPARDDLRFRFGGSEYGPFDDRNGQLRRAGDDETPRYDSERGAGWVLFELPDRGDAGDAALTWANGEWRPGEDLRSRLASARPPLSLSWSVPDAVPPGEDVPLDFEVANEGDQVGWFVAGLDRTGPTIAYAPMRAIARRIPPGGTVAWTVTDSLSVGPTGTARADDGGADMTYVLDWTGATERRSVRVTSDA